MNEIKMEKRIVLGLMVATLSFSLCDALVDIFGHTYRDKISAEELNRRLTEGQFDPDATETAQLLADARNKYGKPEGSGDYTVHDLLYLATRPYPRPLKVCDANHFDHFKKVCKTLSGPTGNIRLLNYCIHCRDAHFEFCANQPEGLFNLEMEKFEPTTGLAEISEQISEYIDRHGGDDSEEDNIAYFMRKLANRNLITRNCAEMLKTVKRALLLFDEKDERTSKFLAEVQKTGSDLPQTFRVIYKRCAIISKLPRN